MSDVNDEFEDRPPAPGGVAESVSAFFDAAAKSIKDGRAYKYCTPSGRPSVPALLAIFRADFKGKLSTWRNASPRRGTPRNQLLRTDDLIAIFSEDLERLFHNSNPLVEAEKQSEYNEVSKFWDTNLPGQREELVVHLQSYRNDLLSFMHEFEAKKSKEKAQKAFEPSELEDAMNRLGGVPSVTSQTPALDRTKTNAEGEQQSSSQVLSSRLELMTAIMAEMQGDLHSYRATTVGPNFIHPDWVVEIRNRQSTTPNYEAIYFKKVVFPDRHRLHTHRIFFRNTARYKDKVNKLVEQSERSSFIDDMLERIRFVWGENYDLGPSIRCHNVGFFRVEIVFPNSLISGRRLQENQPVSGGILIRDPVQIVQERAHFDQIFEAGYLGQELEVQALESFVRNLWTSSGS